MSKRVGLSKYKGEWVLLCEDKVVAHSNDAQTLRNAVKKCKSIPTLMLVPKHKLLL